MERVDLTAFATWVDAALADGAPMVIATSLDDQPDVAFKGSLMVWDADHLAFWERSHLETLESLRANPRTAVLYRHPERGQPLRFYGEASVVESGAVRDEVWERVVPVEKSRDPERGGVAVLIRIDRVRRGREIIQSR